MRGRKLFTIVLSIAILGYVIYLLVLFVGISSSFPSIKEYNLAASEIKFEEKLAERINATPGWSFEKTDSVNGQNGEVCDWASISYIGGGQQLWFEVKYCTNSDSLNPRKECMRLYLIGAFDYVNGTGGYKLSDKGVEELVKILDDTLVGLASDCSKE